MAEFQKGCQQNKGKFVNKPPPYSVTDPSVNPQVPQHLAVTNHASSNAEFSYQQPSISRSQIPGLTNQNAQQSGVTLVVAATDPEPTEIRSCVSKMSFGLSICQLLTGFLFVASQIAQNILRSALSVGQSGIIAGLIFTASGILGILAYKKGKRAYYIGLLALSISSICTAIAMFPLQLTDMLITSIMATHGDEYSRSGLQSRIAINAVFLVGAFLQGVFALWASIVACDVICGCCAPQQNKIVAQYTAGSTNGSNESNPAPLHI